MKIKNQGRSCIVDERSPDWKKVFLVIPGFPTKNRSKGLKGKEGGSIMTNPLNIIVRKVYLIILLNIIFYILNISCFFLFSLVRKLKFVGYFFYFAFKLYSWCYTNFSTGIDLLKLVLYLIDFTHFEYFLVNGSIDFYQCSLKWFLILGRSYPRLTWLEFPFFKQPSSINMVYL